MNDNLKQYLCELNRLLPCSTKEKKRCIAELESDASAYLEQNPDASMEELHNAIGTPQSIAQAFMARLNPEQLSHRLSTKRKILIGVLTIATLLAFVIGIAAISVANDVHDIQNGYFTDFIGDSTETEPPITSKTEVY